MDEIRVNDLASRFAAICGAAHVEAGEGIGARYHCDAAFLARVYERAQVAVEVAHVEAHAQKL